MADPYGIDKAVGEGRQEDSRVHQNDLMIFTLAMSNWPLLLAVLPVLLIAMFESNAPKEFNPAAMFELIKDNSIAMIVILGGLVAYLLAPKKNRVPFPFLVAGYGVAIYATTLTHTLSTNVITFVTAGFIAGVILLRVLAGFAYEKGTEEDSGAVFVKNRFEGPAAWCVCIALAFGCIVWLSLKNRTHLAHHGGGKTEKVDQVEKPAPRKGIILPAELSTPAQSQ